MIHFLLLQVFHMDFKRVETYFILGIWVFIGSSLKILYRVLEEAGYVGSFPEVCVLLSFQECKHFK